jgi:hypothetical protein
MNLRSARPAGPGAVWLARAATDLVAAQAAELTPAPAVDATPLAETARRWAGRWNDVASDPARYLPHWAAARAGELHARRNTVPAGPRRPAVATPR